VPDDISDDQAMLIEPMAVGVHAVLRRPPQDSDHVLIIGCGAIGLLTLQAARAVAPGCHITAVARYAHQAEAARRYGADEVVSRPTYAEMARITGAHYYAAAMNKGMLLGGFDKVFDCVGTAATLEDGLRWATGGGAVVMVGINLTRLNVDLNPIWYQEVDLVGSLVHGTDVWQGQRRHTYAWVIDLLRAGKLTSDGMITHRFRFEQYKEAVATCLDKKAARPLKVAFNYD
jgi:threonine dehydrogenase-like Zn-dependent dehydrogenase